MESSCYLLPDEILEKSPSSLDGIEKNEEFMHRVFGCELIQEACILLRHAQVVAATGQCILNRFYYRKSLRKFDVFTVAMGCVMLSSKIEEKLKILREVIFVFHHMYQRRKGLKLKALELGGQRYTEWKQELMAVETYILKELGFTLYSIIDHPHKYILYFVKILDGSKELAQKSWNYLNDSMRLDLNLRYPAQVIACAAIFLAAREIAFPLPEDPPCVWWNLVTDDTTVLYHICDSILELYRLPKLTWLEPLADVPYLSPENCAQYDEPDENLRQLPTFPPAPSSLPPSPLPHHLPATISLPPSTSSSSSTSTLENSNHSIRMSKGDGEGEGKEEGKEEGDKGTRERSKSSDRYSERSSTRSRSRDRGKVRDYDEKRGRDRYRSMSRSRSRSRDRDREKGKDRDSDRDRDRDRDRERGRDRDRDRDKRRSRSRERDRDRGRDRERDRNSRDRDRDRDRDRGRDRERDRDRYRGSKRSRSGDRERYDGRNRDRGSRDRTRR